MDLVREWRGMPHWVMLMFLVILTFKPDPNMWLLSFKWLCLGGRMEAAGCEFVELCYVGLELCKPVELLRAAKVSLLSFAEPDTRFCQGFDTCAGCAGCGGGGGCYSTKGPESGGCTFARVYDACMRPHESFLTSSH